MPTPTISVAEPARPIASPDAAHGRQGRAPTPALFYGELANYLLKIDGRHETVMLLPNASC